MKAIPPDFARITRNASKTFYFASLLYPKAVRNDIHILYAFLRTSDDMVDAPQVDMARYEKMKAQTKQALAGEKVNDSIVQAFGQLVKRRNLDEELVWDYFASQDIDLANKSYATYAKLSRFIYGVAEVVGLYMAQIMELHPDSYPYARKLGEAMQLVNIARDIDEDTKAGKCYIPQDERVMCNLTEPLTKEYALAHRDAFIKLMQFQLDRAQRMLRESRTGLTYFPKQYLLPIMVSMDLYESVIKQISHNPLIVFERKVRLSLFKILFTVLSVWFSRLTYSSTKFS